jgi:UDP-N-acetyl-D-mannosaminuronic acid dehydrogenase
MSETDKRVSVIGLGYIGLPTAALLASRGYMVNGMDVNPHVVDTINKGGIHIVEPDLDTYVKSAVESDKLKAHLEVQPADVYIICVPTPFHSDSKIPTPNINYVLAAAAAISPYIKDGDLVILESTSPVGTTERIRDFLDKKGVNTSAIFLAYCPERVLPGNIMAELVENARVIGGINPESTRAVSSFYKSFVQGELLETKADTAEMCKLTENSFRDVNIAFANELSVICDRNGVDVWDLIKLANHHPRVNVLQPGTGVGGHCIAVDPWFIVSDDPENARIIRTAREVNDYKPEWVVKKIKSKADSQKTKKIACLGLAFKPDIDDLRESPSVKVVDELIRQGYEVYCVEPNIVDHSKYTLLDVNQAIYEADVLALLVNHKEFKAKNILRELTEKGVLDFCGGMQEL